MLLGQGQGRSPVAVATDVSVDAALATKEKARCWLLQPAAGTGLSSSAGASAVSLAWLRLLIASVTCLFVERQTCLKPTALQRPTNRDTGRSMAADGPKLCGCSVALVALTISKGHSQTQSLQTPGSCIVADVFENDQRV